LKGKFVTSKKGNLFSQLLVVFQFTMAIILISGTVIILDQMNFIQNKNLGFATDATMLIPLREGSMRRKFETIQNELKSIAGVEEVGASSNVPGSQFNQNPIYATDDPNHQIDASQMYVDYDLIKTLDLEIVEGRGFDRSFPGDSANAYIINQATAHELQLANPVGKEIVLVMDEDELRGTIVGVIKDFNYQSLHQPVRPVIMQKLPYYNTVLIRLNSENVQQTIASIASIWEKFDNTFGFEYSFLEENINSQYTSENKMGLVFGLFAGIAIIISCMGLFGLASLNFAQRKKEVGIRKVLGAPTTTLLMNLAKGYSKLIIGSTLLAVPIAWWIMNGWLNNFVFKIDINIWIFLLTGLGTLLIAWLTIGYLTVHTASLNPVDTLKEE
jgi:putative ABC transport system permease protein